MDGGARLKALSIVRISTLISTIQRDHSILEDPLKVFFRQWWVLKKVACVGSVCDRVIARTMERERAKKGGVGGGEERKGLLSTTRDVKVCAVVKGMVFKHCLVWDRV